MYTYTYTYSYIPVYIHVHVIMNVPNTQVRFEFVADEDSTGSSSVDINKAQLPAGMCVHM